MRVSPEASLKPPRKLLIVDDEKKICDLQANYFSLKGYDVRTVQQGEEAVPLAKVFQPDVVLLDLLLPGMSGVDTLKLLKTLVPTPRVIMLSAADLEEVAVGALKLGADSYVCKPPELAHLEQLISGIWLSRKR